MKNLLTLIQKNFRLLLRARMSSLIVILGPLLVIFLIGTAFDNSTLFKVNVGTYAQEYTPLVNSFLDDLAEQKFRITQFESESDCIGAIKTGVVHICASFNDQFDLSNAANQITFYADFSRVNLVYNLLDATSSSIALTRDELSLNLTKQLLQTLEDISKLMQAKKSILITLTTQNDNMYQRIADIHGALGGVNLSIDKNLFETGNLTDQQAKVDFLMKRIDGLFIDNIDVTQKVITDMRSKLDTMTITETDKNNISQLLDTAEDDIKELEAQMDVLVNDAQKDVHELGTTATSLITNLDETSKKIREATDIGSSSRESLDFVRFTIDRSLTNIIEMQNTVNIIENKVNEVKVTDPATIVNPVTTIVKPITTDTSRLNYIFPVLLILLAMFTSILLVSTLIQLEKRSKAVFRNFLTPTKDITFIFSTFLTSLIIILLQIVIILVVAGLVFSTQILFTLFDTITILFFVTCLFTSIGMVIGYALKSQETTSLASISIGALFLFVSDVILPLETVPSAISWLATYNPFVLAVNLLRRTILFQSRIFSMGSDILFLMVYSAVLFFLVVLVYKMTKKRAMTKAVFFEKQRKK